MRTSSEVMRIVQVNTGIRNIVIPGARIVMIVTAKFTAPRMVATPPTARPKTHRSPPTPGLYVEFDSGA